MQPELTKTTSFRSKATIVTNANLKFSLADLPKNEAKIKLGSNIILECTEREVTNQCTKDNTFDNPLFINNEVNGRSNWKTDRSIMTYSYESGNLVLPRGYMRDLLKVFQDHEMSPPIIMDNRISNTCIYPDKLHGIELRPYQQRAVEEALKFDQGCIISPTGSGKSLIGLEIIRKRSQKALILCHRGELAKQWVNVIKERIGIDAGFIGNGKWEIGDITVAMIQTLTTRENELKSLSKAFGLILLDEVHHAPASTFFDVLGCLESKFRYGLSATPKRSDGLEQMIYRSIGPEVVTITKQEVENIGATVPITVISMQTGFKPNNVNSWSEYLDSLSFNAERNIFIINLAQQITGSVLILVDRVAHAEQISEMFNKRKIEHVLAHGKIKKTNREYVMAKIKSAKITIGTTSLLGEGLDVSNWSTLILGSPISSEIKLMQAIGRVVRPAQGKNKAIVYDLKDDCGFSGASFKKRFEMYKKNKIWIEFRK